MDNFRNRIRRPSPPLLSVSLLAAGVLVVGSWLGWDSSRRLVYSAPTSNQPQATVDSPNGAVTDMAQGSDGTLYVAGSFSSFGALTGHGVPINTATGIPVAGFPVIHGDVRAAVADGNGGWYIGGTFLNVGTTARQNLVHILSNNTIDPVWNPGADGVVNSLVINGTSLYVGGDFTTIAGASHARLAKFDLTNGSLVGAWNPSVDAAIHTLAINGSTLYVGGTFSSVRGTARSRLAAIDTSSGNLLSFDPSPNSTVNALAFSPSGSTLYVGGAFTTFASSTRRRLASVDLSSGNLTSWDPNVNGGFAPAIYTLAPTPDGTAVFVGGWFSQAFHTIGGQSRSAMAKLNTTTGAADATWDQPASQPVFALALNANGSLLYAGNYHNSGYPVLTAHSTSGTGTPTSWEVRQNHRADVLVLSSDGSSIFAGGRFSITGATDRMHLAAINPATGSKTSWDPGVSGGNALVNGLAVSGSTVFVGGDFSSIAGVGHTNLAALDATTGVPRPWNLDTDQPITAVTLTGNTLIVAGKFETIGGLSRSGLAAINVSTGAVTNWTPNGVTDSPTGIKTMTVSGSTLYVGGVFTSIGGQSRTYLAAFDLTTGALLAWNPSPNNEVKSLLVHGSTVYLGGLFATVGGQARANIAAVNANTGALLSWSPGANGTVEVFATDGELLFIGGAFTTLAGQPRAKLAAAYLSTGTAHSWTPDPDNTVFSLLTGSEILFVGGNFATIGGTSYPYLASYANPPPPLPTIHFGAASSSGSESVASPSVSVALSITSSQDATVNYAVTGGTATAGSDFTLAPNILTIPAGATTGSIPLSIINDSLDEPDETVVITLSNPSQAALGTPSSFTYTIIDNDVDSTPPAAVIDLGA